MAVMYINNRQYPRHAVAVVNGDLSLGSKILLPPRALITGGGITVVTAIAGTSPTITMVDNAGSPFTFLSAIAAGTTTVAALATNSVGRYYAAGAELTISLGGTPTAGTGKAIIHLQYIEELAENELYGRSA